MATEQKMNLAQRLQFAYDMAKKENPKLTKAELARTAHVSPGAVGDWFHGRVIQMRTDSAYRIANRLGVSLRWLSSGIGSWDDPTSVISSADDYSDPLKEFVLIREYYAEHKDDVPIIGECRDSVGLCMPRDWFETRNVNPRDVKVFRVIGDSMAPILCNRDLALVDCSDRDPRHVVDGKMYLIRLYGAFVFRRLRRTGSESLTLEPVNPDYDKEKLSYADMANMGFDIVGRVRFRAGGDPV